MADRHATVPLGRCVLASTYVDLGAESEAGAVTDVVASYRVVLGDASIGEGLQELRYLAGERWRSHRLQQQPQPRAAVRPPCRHALVHMAQERIPGREITHAPDSLRAVRIVQAQQRALSVGVRRPKGRWVLRIPFQLGGTAGVALGEETAGVAAALERGCEIERLSQHKLLGLGDVRNDPLRRLV